MAPNFINHVKIWCFFLYNHFSSGEGERSLLEYITWTEDRLEDLVDLWNKELGNDFPMRKELFKQNSFDDPNVLYNGSFIALNDDGQVIGFVVSKQWEENSETNTRGWIQTILVEKSQRGKGIGTHLYNRAVQYFKQNGIKEIQLGGDPAHYFPGIPTQFKEGIAWAESLNFKKSGNSYDLMNHLSKEYPYPNIDQVAFSILKKEEKRDLISFMERCFPGRWTYEAKRYFEMNGEGREFVVAKKDNRIIGFCRINDSKSPSIGPNVYWSPLFEHEVGGIGPLGIDEEERKNGYGLAIVQAAVAILQDRGVETILIDWTGIVDFYAKLNFKPWKEYATYVKQL